MPYPTTPAPWKIRAVQLDLARQRETVDTIQRFIARAAAWGYNTLFLYLEGVVRTPSFPFRPAGQSYDASQIGTIVNHASSRGITVVPGIAGLGHAEHFLSCPELEHLKEQGPDVPGGHMFCPSNPAAIDFLRRYITDVAAMFPAGHLHVGLDEAWPLGTCPACRARLHAGMTRDELFVDHLLKLHAICKSLGRRMWVWDDMLENAPEPLIAEVPRDVVMCAWTYESDGIDLDGCEGHFNNLRRRDWLAIYERLGFDVLICPAAFAPWATLAYSRYARQYDVLGGIQTIWELSGSFLPGQFPGAALAGRLWSDPALDGEETFAAVMRELLPDVDDTELAAAVAVVSEQSGFTGSPWPAGVMRGKLTVAEARSLASLKVHRRLLNDALTRVAPSTQRDVLEELSIRARDLIVQATMRQLVSDCVDPRLRRFSSEARQRTQQHCLADLRDLAGLRAAQWTRHRPGIEPERASSHYGETAVKLTELLAGLDAIAPDDKAMLDLRLHLWDSFSAPSLTVELGDAGVWREVFRGGFKSNDLRSAGPYHLRLPLDLKNSRPPDGLRLTVSGFGGLGVCHAGVVTAAATLNPAGPVRTTGIVADPAAVLRDDSSFAYLGSQDTVATLMAQTQKTAATLEVRLARDPEREHKI